MGHSREQSIVRLFDGDRERSKAEHAAHWVREHRPPAGEKWPSRTRVCRAVRQCWGLDISEWTAQKAIAKVRKEPAQLFLKK